MVTKPIKTIHNPRLAYLIGLEQAYKELGYPTKINGRENLLEIYPQGSIVPKTEEELVVEKWID